MKQKREFFRPIDRTEIETHAKTYEETKRELSIQMRRKRERFYEDIDKKAREDSVRFKSKFTDNVLEEKY